MKKLYLECQETVYQIGTMDDDSELADIMSDVSDVQFNDVKEFSPIHLYRNKIPGGKEILVNDDFSNVNIAYLILVIYSDVQKEEHDWAIATVKKTRRCAKQVQQSIITGEFNNTDQLIWDEDGKELESVEIVCLQIED